MEPLLTLMHDTANTIDRIRDNRDVISRWAKDNAKKCSDAGISTTLLFVAVQYLKSYEKRLKDELDAYYNHAKTPNND